MEQLKYIHQCVTQALALEEAGLTTKSMRIANLRYIQSQLDNLVSAADKKEAQYKAEATLQAIHERL